MQHYAVNNNSSLSRAHK